MSKKIEEPSGQAGNRGGPPYEPTMFGSKEETMRTNQPTNQQTNKQSVRERPKRWTLNEKDGAPRVYYVLVY